MLDYLSEENESLVISYKKLRITLGLIGFFLPFSLIIGKRFFEGGGILDSISGYYYSEMRNIFVGALWAIGIFLYSYRGYERKDDIAGTAACFAAIGVALLPTTPGLTATPRETTLGYLHLVCAASFFGLMAFFCLCLFTKSNAPKAAQTPQKRKRNLVYLICGWTIVVCIVAMFLLIFVPTDAWIRAFKPVLILETAAVLAFGFAWFVKGELILKDT
ncbi:MAG TPA: hypothetical protein VFZ66_27285 [Herpetosiphonaceae bacterium]